MSWVPCTSFQTTVVPTLIVTCSGLKYCSAASMETALACGRGAGVAVGATVATSVGDTGGTVGWTGAAGAQPLIAASTPTSATHLSIVRGSYDGRRMDYGFLLDGTFQLSIPEQCDIVRQSTRLGYVSAWSPGGVTSRDAFQTCVQWSAAGGPGFTTGTSVVVAPHWTQVTLAAQAATVADLVQGPFVLGVGSGAVHLA